MTPRHSEFYWWTANIIIIAIMGFLVYSCVPIGPHAQEGLASVYGNEHGQWRRADGRRYVAWQISCAHRTRRLGSVVTVTVLDTGSRIHCPINDRGPFVRGRIIDLSLGAARALGVRGLARVRVDAYR